MNEPYAPIVYTTPPGEAGRLPREMAVYRLLEALRIPYERVDHPAAMTLDDCGQADTALGISLCKNLFLCNRPKTEFYLLLMPGRKPFRTRELSAQIACSRLSFAGAEDMEALLGVTPGSVTLLALMNDTGRRVRLLIDREVLRDPFLGCHPCVNTSSLKLSTDDVLRKFLPHTGHAFTEVSL